MSTPILFLDFDGVIRIANDRGVDPRWQGEKIKALADVCRMAGARVVVVSDLRHSMAAGDLLDCIGMKLGGCFHDYWNPMDYGERWKTIAVWISRHDVDHFAILDDHARHYDFAPSGIREGLMVCNSRFGFQPEKQGRQLLKLLGHESPPCDQTELALE